MKNFKPDYSAFGCFMLAPFLGSLVNQYVMDKQKAGRSSTEQKERGQEKQKGAPAKSNRQTGGGKRHERDDSNGGAETNTTKKQENSI